MKNYKINLFDNKELLKEYSDSISPVIYFYNIQELILKLYDTKEKHCNITYQLHEQEILLVAQNKDYITPDGYLYDEKAISVFDDNYTERVDEEWIIHYTDTTVTDKRELEKNVSTINDLTYLSDKDTEIYLNIKAEELYTILTRLWFEITWFSWYKDPTRPIDLASSVSKIFSFNIHILSKKIFKEKATELLESEIDIKWYTIPQSKKDILEKIKKLDEKYWTNWKDVLVENDKKYKYFKYTLILLHLEDKIHITKYYSSNKEFKVNILKSKEIIAKSYDVKEWSLIINNWETTIPLWNLEELIMDEIKYSDDWSVLGSYFNSKNPTASVKKIRKKLEDAWVINFKIPTKRDRYSWDITISVKIT